MQSLAMIKKVCCLSLEFWRHLSYFRTYRTSVFPVASLQLFAVVGRPWNHWLKTGHGNYQTPRFAVI